MAASASNGKERVGKYSLAGLALAWDDKCQVRDRLRNIGRLLLRWDPKLKKEEVANQVETSIHNARVNRHVLSPILKLVRLNGMLQPNLDQLIEEIGGAYGKNKVMISAELVYHEAWSIRHLITLLKGEGCRLKGKDGAERPTTRKMKDCHARLRRVQFVSQQANPHD